MHYRYEKWDFFMYYIEAHVDIGDTVCSTVASMWMIYLLFLVTLIQTLPPIYMCSNQTVKQVYVRFYNSVREVGYVFVPETRYLVLIQSGGRNPWIFNSSVSGYGMRYVFLFTLSNYVSFLDLLFIECRRNLIMSSAELFCGFQAD